MSGLRRRLMRLAMLALFLAIWEAAFRVGLLSPIIFASPSLIVNAAAQDGWTFLLAFRITVFEIAVAILIAWTLGIAFGVVAGSLPVLARISAPVLSALIAVPLVVLYPVLIAWLGLGPASKVVFGVVSGIFPIALNTMVGVREINRGYATMAAAMGANRRQSEKAGADENDVPVAIPLRSRIDSTISRRCRGGRAEPCVPTLRAMATGPILSGLSRKHRFP